VIRWCPRRSKRIAAKSSSIAASSKSSSKPYDRPSRTISRRPVRAAKKAKDTPSQTLYIRANRRFLNVIPQATATEPKPHPTSPTPGTTGNLNLIIAELPKLHPYSTANIDWLLKVARLILEPLSTGSLYTFTSESVEYWLEKEMDFNLSQWRQVQPGEPLTATNYEFRPNNFVTPTRLSLHEARSMTSDTSASQATPLRDALLDRDVM